MHRIEALGPLGFKYVDNTIGWPDQSPTLAVGKGGSRLRSQARLHCRPLCRSAGACCGAFAQRGQPDPGVRLQPTGPLIKPGLCQIVTNDYKRHAATTTPVRGARRVRLPSDRLLMLRHRHIEFIRFLNAAEREVCAGKSLHPISTPATPIGRAALRRLLHRHNAGPRSPASGYSSRGPSTTGLTPSTCLFGVGATADLR